MLRILIGAVIGAAVAVALIAGIELLNHRIFAWAVADPQDMESIRAAVETAPLTAKAMIVGGYFVGALGGGLVAKRIARGSAWAGWIVAVLILGGGVATLAAIPHPLWMQIATVAAPLLAGLVVRGA